MAKKLFIILIIISLAVLAVFAFVGYAVNRGWTNTPGRVDYRFSRLNLVVPKGDRSIVPLGPVTWSEGEDWPVLEAAFRKDEQKIKRAAAVAGVSPRLLFSMVAVEQLRLYNSDRQIFKEIFSPLKILGNQVKFSWGVGGIKEATALDIERHLGERSSPYYLGPEYEHLLDFTTADPEAERFARIANERDHYYSYLYGALYLKQFIVAWERAGYPIADQPAVLGTLYNIGFAHSDPKPDPAVGGSVIEVGGATYSFGGLAHDIFFSTALLDIFPE